MFAIAGIVSVALKAQPVTTLPGGAIPRGVPFSEAFTKSAVAEAAWEDLNATLKAARPERRNDPPGEAKRTPAQIAQERATAADRYAVVSQQAKDFHTQHPKDINAAKARKMEVTAALESARLGKNSMEVSALALATSYRKDKRELREHRFEVALMADRLQLRKANNGKSAREKPSDHEKMADNLLKEFGPIPEVFGLYAGIARDADMQVGNRIAMKITEMRPPEPARLAADKLTTPYGFVQTKLSLRLAGADGSTVELSTLPANAGPTVVYFWTKSASRAAFAPLAAERKNIKGESSVRWIYVAVGQKPEAAAAARTGAPYAGIHCADPGGATLRSLAIEATPTVFVLNRSGAVTGFGRVDELPALLAGANR